MLTLSKGTQGQEKKDLQEQLELAILSALKDLRFGSVEIIVHDSKVVQIERKEKVRLESGYSHSFK
ncbi:hypothetical protein W02_01560 [Nitrospira sp. KM1]|nr:DUF2292 domain-containing protein [Nitrospira sp. KM1]BCA53016.1 hypothetical protein W02_01560 [Nitrospira sp. KM1]